MLNEKNRKTISVFLWLLVALCMAVIFILSSRTATESSMQSNAIVKLLCRLFKNSIFTDFIVRKAAHCLEFTGLAFLLNAALLVQCKKRRTLLATSLTSLYAATDEFHQLFVEGRSCQLTDWAIDTAGALIGSLLFIALFYIISAIYNKK